jgi:hypothetical protein
MNGAFLSFLLGAGQKLASGVLSQKGDLFRSQKKSSNSKVVTRRR